MVRIVFFIALSLITTTISKAQCVVGDCENGFGIFKLENGDMYTGDWENGTRDGYGRYDWANGAFYVGDFKFNGFHGKGAFYGADGAVASGIFQDNLFQGPDTSVVAPEFVAPPDMVVWEQWLAADNEAKLAAGNGNLDLATLVLKVVADFPNNFTALRAVERPLLIERQSGWYASAKYKNSPEAGITASANNKSAYYNILNTRLDSAEARKKYNEYVQIIKTLKIPCCSNVSDTYNFAGKTYSSYTTSWLTLMVNEGYDETIYDDMVIEIALNTMIDSDAWQITFKVYHLSAVGQGEE